MLKAANSPVRAHILAGNPACRGRPMGNNPTGRPPHPPIYPAPAVAMWRPRTLHLKGFGLAVAAVVINVLYTIAVIWMAFNGYDAMSLYQEALQQLTGGTGSSSDSISA